MTSTEMLYVFENKYRAHNKINKDVLSSSDFEMFANNALENLTIKYAKTFEGEEFSRLVLMKLYRVASYTYSQGFSDSTTLANGRYFELPDDYKFPTNIEEATITISGITYNPRVKPITDLHYNLNESVNNPYKQPYGDMIWRIDYGKKQSGNPGMVHQIVVPSGATLVNYKIHYIKQPVYINVSDNNTCELSETVHNELVDEAVRLAVLSSQANKSI